MRKTIVMVAGLLVACSSNHGLELDVSGTSVELDAYSGMPNPVWRLTPQEVAVLEARLDGLPEASGTTPEHLGYRGFLIQSRSAPQIRVYSGMIFVGEKVFRDVSDAEAWLVAYAARHGSSVPR